MNFAETVAAIRIYPAGDICSKITPLWMATGNFRANLWGWFLRERGVDRSVPGGPEVRLARLRKDFPETASATRNFSVGYAYFRSEIDNAKANALERREL